MYQLPQDHHRYEGEVYNMKRHFTSVHPKKAVLPGDKKKTVFGRPRAQLKKQCTFVKRIIPQFENPTWVCYLGFLVDITGHLNELNIQLQGKGVLVPDHLFHMKAFEC